MSRRDRLTYRVLMLVGVAALAAFYGWWFQVEHWPDNGVGWWQVVDVVVFLALTGVLSHRIFMDVYVWVVARRIRPLQEPPEPEVGLRVAFITTFVPGAEGLDLLARTLPAIQAVDYPHDTWLLDEGADPQARALCEQLGVHYFTRHGVEDYNEPAGPFTARTKGGNHNAWHDAHGGAYDVVAQIDTDFPPRRDFLLRTLGYFRDPEIGWVITPQVYGNTGNLVTRGAAEQQFTFYGPVLRGLAGRGLANMLGANHVVRTAALDDIGLYAGHITEDLLTGLRLHGAGWRSEYVPEVLAVGEGPDTWRSYFSQQRRWAYGCMHVLRHHRGPLRGMAWRDRLLYLSLMQGYFSGLVGAVGCALLVAYFLGGLQISGLTLTGLLIWAGPLFVARQVIRFWLQRFAVRPGEESGLLLASGVVSIACWPVYFQALVRVLRNQPLTFAVTPKGRVRKDTTRERRQFRPHLLWAATSLACLAAVPLTGRDSVVLVFWAVLNVLTLGALYLAADHEIAVRRRGEVATVVDPDDVVPAQRLLVAAGAGELVVASSSRPSLSAVHADVVDDVALREDGVG